MPCLLLTDVAQYQNYQDHNDLTGAVDTDKHEEPQSPDIS